MYNTKRELYYKLWTLVNDVSMLLKLGCFLHLLENNKKKTDFRTIYDGIADEAALVTKILPEVPWVEFILKSIDMWRDKIKERENI